MPTVVSYAQRFEDLYLMRCFGDRRAGFYIDIGSGHPVYDDISFTLYLNGWSGAHGRARSVAGAAQQSGASARRAPGGHDGAT